MQLLQTLAIVFLILGTANQVALCILIVRHLPAMWLKLGLVLVLTTIPGLLLYRVFGYQAGPTVFLSAALVYGLGWTLVGMSVFGIINGVKK